MKNLFLAIAVAALLAACSSDTVDPTPDPNPTDTVSGADTTFVQQLADTVAIDIWKGNSTYLKSYSVYLARPSKLQHDITFSSLKGLSSGSVTVSVMKNEETLWQHTFTTDSTTWNVTGQAQGSISTIKVQSSKATGRIEGRIIGR
jgi:outer membrane biogenesis lipoprotein LolB